MTVKTLKTLGITILVGVALIVAGAAVAGVLPVPDQNPATNGSGGTPAQNGTPGGNDSGNLGSDVAIYEDPSLPGAGNVSIGDGSAAGETIYTVTNNGSESKRVTITIGFGNEGNITQQSGLKVDETPDGATETPNTDPTDTIDSEVQTIAPEDDEGGGFSLVRKYELDPGESVRITFNGTANYSLTVDVVGGGTETYDVTVDCNTRRTSLVITPEGNVEEALSASTVMACLTETP